MEGKEGAYGIDWASVACLFEKFSNTSLLNAFPLVYQS